MADIAMKPRRRIAVPISFVVIGGLLLLMTAVGVFALRSDTDAPAVRDEVARGVQRAVDSGDLSVDTYRVASNVGFVNPDSVSPVVGLLPEISGVELYTHGLNADGASIDFEYRGSGRAPGFCFPGSVDSDGTVNVTAVDC